ncbi:hypothetical protein QQP08_012900 [Theobroma cacao]|nr:hypothetical protein QQP08_012900 [Theobroma cacao]
MDFVEVKGVARNGLTMEWIKLKTIGKGSYGLVHLVKPIKPIFYQVLAVKSCLYQDSFSLRKEQHILKEFVGCRNIVPCFGDMLSTDQEGALVYNLFLEYVLAGIWFVEANTCMQLAIAV